MDNLISKINEIYNRTSLPDEDRYIESLTKVNEVLSSEDSTVRPKDNNGLGGGVIYLNKEIITIVISDLHARVDFIKNLLDFKISGTTILELLTQKQIQIICVGDGFHSEGRAKQRWLLALDEFLGGYKKHKHIDEEMVESLNLMELVFLLKVTFPEHFHFLKGNHENILNEGTEGNRSFGKFAKEGVMVKTYVEKFFSKEFIQPLYNFEKKLPILAVGKNFLISHGEPRKFYPLEEVINYYQNDQVIFDFTWTRNGDADDDSVEDMLDYYCSEYSSTSLYYGGHRPVSNLYQLRANGRFIQFHNSIKQTIVIIPPDIPMNLDTNIIDIIVTREI